MPGNAPSQAPAKKGWLSRNWKWALPTGCLAVGLMFAAVIGLIVWGVFAMMKSSDAYKQAVSRAQADARVQTALGAPVEPGAIVSGNIQVNGPSGNANLAIPLEGSKGAGTLYVAARKSGGQWSFDTLVLQVEATGERIDLLAPPGRAP